MKRSKHLFATGPLHNLAPNRSEEVFVRTINTSQTTPATLLLRVVMRVTGITEAHQTTWTQAIVEPATSDVKGFRVSDAEEFRIEIESDVPHVVVSIWGVDEHRRVVKAHRVLHSQLSWVR